MYTVSI